MLRYTAINKIIPLKWYLLSGLIVCSRHALAGLFQSTSNLFGSQFSLFRGFCWPCFLTWLRLFACLSNQGYEPIEGILTVLLLASEASCLDNQNTFFRHPLPRQFFQAVVDLGRKTVGLSGVEAKLDSRGNLVHMLPPGAGCPDEIEGHIVFRDLNVRCNLDHGDILRYLSH